MAHETHMHVAHAGRSSCGAYLLKHSDCKIVPAEVVAIHQPAGRFREGGGYFACIEFRKLSAPAASYAVDFLPDPDAHSVTVETTHPFEIPHAGSGKATPESPCRFEASAFDVVE